MYKLKSVFYVLGWIAGIAAVISAGMTAYLAVESPSIPFYRYAVDPIAGSLVFMFFVWRIKKSWRKILLLKIKDLSVVIFLPIMSLGFLYGIITHKGILVSLQTGLIWICWLVFVFFVLFVALLIVLAAITTKEYNKQRRKSYSAD
ncbi:MAG: hypothetical protein WC414_03415 [Patescibacteria group bacterium]